MPDFSRLVTKALEATGIRAFHGSPKKFDKFDVTKIGEGQGAQSYGHGLYFAGNEDVAKSYRDSLSPTIGAHNTFEGKRINPSMVARLQASPDPDVAYVFQNYGVPYGRPGTVTRSDLGKLLDRDIATQRQQMEHFLQRASESRANPPLASTYTADDFDRYATAAMH